MDSFGHSPVLPQILQKSGMKEYIFMRPRLDTPVFVWESDDGTPGECHKPSGGIYHLVS